MFTAAGGRRALDLVTGDVIRGARPRGLRPFNLARLLTAAAAAAVTGLPIEKTLLPYKHTHTFYTRIYYPEKGAFCVCVWFVGLTHFVKVPSSSHSVSRVYLNCGSSILLLPLLLLLP